MLRAEPGGRQPELPLFLLRFPPGTGAGPAAEARDGAQFIIASHSPVLLALPGAELLSFDEGVLHPCDYTQTESYRITSLFINRREWFLKQLLEEDPHVF